jgi:hypothetical protein
MIQIDSNHEMSMLGLSFFVFYKLNLIEIVGN